MFAFCKPVSSKKRFLPFREINKDYSFSLYDKVTSVPSKDWTTITKNQTVFLEKEYLDIVEHGEHTRLKCRYVIVYHKKIPCGIIYFQVVDFKAGIFGDLLTRQVETIRTTRMSLFEKYIDSNKEEILLRLFTCGNNLISGEYGFLFDKKTDPVLANEILLKIVDLISKEEKLRGTISAILLKDFKKPLLPKKLFNEENYSEFSVEPNLIVELPRGISSVNEYTDRFSKKYRNRARSIFKNFAGIEVRELDETEIKKQEKEIYELYENIFEKAKFKLIKLPTHYFLHVKNAFRDTFTFKGFYSDGSLVAFATSFVMPDGTLEAHYIGFDYELNNTFDLYQNILYSMIGEGIKHKCKTVNLGRTAAEIKTTVGAKPENLVCYIKPQNTISRLIQKPFISFLQPAEWIPRNPFKEETIEKKPITPLRAGES